MKALPAGRLEPSEVQSWKSVEGLVHEVWDNIGAYITSRCMIADIRKHNRARYVYGTRSSTYLPAELDDANNQVITCLWCITDTFRI